MDRRQFLQFLGGASVAAARNPRPLNFVFILIDDMGWTDLGCQGGEQTICGVLVGVHEFGRQWFSACPTKIFRVKI